MTTDDEACEEADAGDPYAHAVKEGVEEFSVFVEGFLPGKDEKVSGEVASEEED